MDEKFRAIRRKERALGEERGRELLLAGEYGVLSLCGANGYGYGVPLSYVVENDSLYFHCAPEGFKLDSLRANPRASFCVVGATQVQPRAFSTLYESVVVFGTVETELPEGERHRALELLVEKYSPEYREESQKYIALSFARTRILRLDIEHLSAKGKLSAKRPPLPEENQ